MGGAPRRFVVRGAPGNWAVLDKTAGKVVARPASEAKAVTIAQDLNHKETTR